VVLAVAKSWPKVVITVRSNWRDRPAGLRPARKALISSAPCRISVAP
jgi:hypothetical protein